MNYCIAFLSVLICILSTILIDVFIVKGSTLFAKMSEDLQIDAKIFPSMKIASEAQGSSATRLNFTRIIEI